VHLARANHRTIVARRLERSECSSSEGDVLIKPVLQLLLLMLLAAPAAVAQTAYTYEYDAFGRLTKAAQGSAGQTAYFYDAADNRTKVSNAKPTAIYDYVFDVAWDVWSYTGYLWVLSNDTDPDLPGETLTVTSASGSSYVSINNNDLYLSGAPPGAYSLSYTIKDSTGLTSSASVDVEIIYCTTWGGC
jgi:YD repeat-containing protein